jgi:hypothetical protein
MLLLAKLFSWPPAARVLLVWVHDRTGSLPMTMLMHASVSATSVVLALPALSCCPVSAAGPSHFPMLARAGTNRDVHPASTAVHLSVNPSTRALGWRAVAVPGGSRRP